MSKVLIRATSLIARSNKFVRTFNTRARRLRRSWFHLSNHTRQSLSFTDSWSAWAVALLDKIFEDTRRIHSIRRWILEELCELTLPLLLRKGVWRSHGMRPGIQQTAFSNDSEPPFITPPFPTRLACLAYLFCDKRVQITGGYEQ